MALTRAPFPTGFDGGLPLPLTVGSPGLELLVGHRLDAFQESLRPLCPLGPAPVPVPHTDDDHSRRQ